MNIAIPVYENRVMPRFGCTREMIIVSVEDGKIISNKQLTITLQADILRLAVSEQVSVLICGGIHPRFQQILQEQNIELVWGVVGEWQEVLQAYLEGTLQTNPTFCPHQGRRRGLRFRKRHTGGENYARI